MKFADLFLPKIARSDPKVRKEAIKTEEDKAMLQKVLKNDSDPDVRDAAQRRLEEISAQPG